MAFCIECGTQLKRSAVSCPECGHPVEDETTPPEPTPKPGSPRTAPRRARTRPRPDGAKARPRPRTRARPVPSAEPDEHERADLQEPPKVVDLPDVRRATVEGNLRVEGPGAVAGRIAGIFAVVGFGLGVATLLYLWESGFFDSGGGESFEDFARVAVGVFALVLVAIFAVPLGVVLAAIGGVFAASRTANTGEAVRAGAVGSAAGYLALSLILSGFFVLAIEISNAAESDQPSPTPSQQQQQCEQVFGDGAPQCQNLGPQAEIEVFPDIEDTDGWTNDIARLGLGIIPAALVGALSAVVASSRRRQTT